MGSIEGVRQRVRVICPKFTTSVVYARPLPLVPEERPDAGPDFRFKIVYNPDDSHLQQIESAKRLARMRGPMACGVFAILAIHIPTDRAIGKIWVQPHTPQAKARRIGIPHVSLARDEVYLLDLWIEREFRRQTIAMTLVYELSAFNDFALPDVRWIYCIAHKKNTASRQLFELFFGLYPVQQVTTLDWGVYTRVLPFTDRPRFGPFSRDGRHQGLDFRVPGRTRGDEYRDYHHAEGFARQKLSADVVNDWPPPGPDYFDNEPVLDVEGNLGTPATVERPTP
jgi:hypothetical protein